MKFVTKKIHAFIDYPVAIALIIMPFILGLGSSHIMAFYASVVTGVAALMLTLFTDHETGVFKIISYKIHLAVDFAVAITFLILPFVFGFKGIDLIYYIANGVAVLTVVGLHKGEEMEKQKIAEPKFI